MKKNRSWPHSFRDAVSGIFVAAAKERNFRVQLIMAVLAVFACVFFRVETWQFVLVAFAIIFVLAMELMNTAIEAVVDLQTNGEYHPLAKIAKDAAAGAVLLASAFALVVAAVVAVDVVRRFF